MNDLLANQKNVKYLTYAIYDTKSRYEIDMANLNGRHVKLRFEKKNIDEFACIAKILSVLLEMERGEAWKIKRLKTQD